MDCKDLNSDFHACTAITLPIIFYQASFSLFNSWLLKFVIDLDYLQSMTISFITVRKAKFSLDKKSPRSSLKILSVGCWDASVSKALSIKLDNFSSGLGIHVVERKTDSCTKSSGLHWSTMVDVCTCPQTCTHTHAHWTMHTGVQKHTWR